jgi:hypothetical protein
MIKVLGVVAVAEEALLCAAVIVAVGRAVAVVVALHPLPWHPPHLTELVSEPHFAVEDRWASY